MMLGKFIRICVLLLPFVCGIGMLHAQYTFYTISDDMLSVHEECSTVKKVSSQGTGSISGAISIAITPEGKLYGTEEHVLFRLNKEDGSVEHISDMHNKDGITIIGNSLVGLNNTTLLTLHKDTLYSIDIASGLATSLGKTEFYSGGDLAFYNGKLYLASNYNDLIEITLSSDYKSIDTIRNIGRMNIEFAFSLCTVYENCESKALFVINGNGLLYKIDPSTAKAEFVCDFATITYDAASFHDFVQASSIFDNINYPNVFSPNSDGINDSYTINDSLLFTSFKIYNRWGKIVYQVHSRAVNWDGTNLDGIKAEEGVYFFSAEIDKGTKTLISKHQSADRDCPSSEVIINKGSITLIR